MDFTALACSVLLSPVSLCTASATWGRLVLLGPGTVKAAVVCKTLNAQCLRWHNLMQCICCPELPALHCRRVLRWRRGGLSGPSACKTACISWSSSCSRRTSRRHPARALQVGLAGNGQPHAHGTEQ